MPITLSIIEVNPLFTDEYTESGGGGVNYLLGSILDKITCNLQFDIWWNSLNVPMVFSSTNKTITRNDVITYNIPTIPSFTISNPLPSLSFIRDGFQIGDSITIEGSINNNGSFTITGVTDKIITVSETLTNETANSISIYGDTPVNSIDYLFNIIENDSPENYISMIDNQTTCKYTISGITTGSAITNMKPIGKSKGWVNGNISIIGKNTTNHVQSFLITHIFFITPAFLSNWLLNIQKSIPPNGLYNNANSVKYIAKINAKYSSTTVTPDQTSNIFSNFKDGNVGFYDEFLNGFGPNYILKSIKFTDVSTALSVDNLQYGRETEVEIHLTSINNKFTSGCKIVLTQLYCPLLDADYINTGNNTMQENFYIDRLMLTEGNSPINGEQYGSYYQSIKNAQAIFINSSELKINYTCSFSGHFNTFIGSKTLNNRNYLIIATPQDLTIETTIGTDRNAIICDTNNYTTDNTDSSLFEIIGGDIYFNSYSDGFFDKYTDFKGFVNDYCLATGDFQIKTGDNTILKSLIFKIEATKIYENNIVLEQFAVNVNSFLPDIDNIQQIDIVENTPFKVNSNSLFSQIKIQRNNSLDSESYTAYNFVYPFKLRYETWINLISESYPNGSQDWSYYQSQGWSIKFNIYAICIDFDNNETDFLHSSNLSVNNFNSTNDIQCTIYMLDSDLSESILFNNQNTIIQAVFKKTGEIFGLVPEDCYGILTADSPQKIGRAHV